MNNLELRQRVEADIRAGSTARAAAERHGVAYATVHYWQRQFGFRRKDILGEATPAPAETMASGSVEGPAGFGAALAATWRIVPAVPESAEAQARESPQADVDDALAIARRALADADALRRRGDFLSADRAVRLAERLLRTRSLLDVSSDGDEEVPDTAQAVAQAAAADRDAEARAAQRLVRRCLLVGEALRRGEYELCPAWIRWSLERGVTLGEGYGELMRGGLEALDTRGEDFLRGADWPGHELERVQLKIAQAEASLRELRLLEAAAREVLERWGPSEAVR